MRKFIFLACLLSVFSLHARKSAVEKILTEQPKTNEVQAPWLTGPLIAPSGVTIPPGHYNIEPYIYLAATTGRYDSHWKAEKTDTFWNNYFQTSLQFGLTKWLDCQFNPAVFYNRTKGVSQWALSDMPIGLDFELYTHGTKITEWSYSFKLSLYEVLPMGKYQNLDPKKLGTDIGGTGSWQTGLGLTWGNLFYLGNRRFLTARFNFIYALPAPVHVKNLNAYGGAPGTRGTVYPAQNFRGDIGLELTLTKNWALAMDIVGSWYTASHFKGKTLLSNTAPPSAQFSLAPAIEYNWNGNLGIIFGPWFTVAGRNASKFTTGVFAFNYYH